MSTFLFFNCFVVVQSLSHVWLFVIPQTAAGQASLSFIISWSLLKLMSIESMMPFNHLSLCYSLLLLPWVCSQHHSLFLMIWLCVRWPKYWSFSFSISLSNQYSGCISFIFFLFFIFLFLGLFPLVLTGLISLLSKGLPRVFSNTTVWKHQFNNYFAYFCVFFLPKWQLVKLFWGHFYIKVWLPW